MDLDAAIEVGMPPRRVIIPGARPFDYGTIRAYDGWEGDTPIVRTIFYDESEALARLRSGRSRS